MSKSLLDPREILHCNRDENSFTARLFEGILFPQFHSDPSAFKGFLKKINESSIKNLEYLNQRFESSFPESKMVPEDLEFVDAMLFVECVDMFSALGKGYEDKTEFDCMIFGMTTDGKIYAIVIEIKAYADATGEEIRRQREHLEKLQELNLFDIYHHCILISYDNLLRARKSVFEEIINNLSGNSILTWENFREYLSHSTRFIKTDFTLFKTIGKEDGIGKTLRHLLKY